MLGMVVSDRLLMLVRKHASKRMASTSNQKASYLMKQDEA
jgi:hypothetical protein